MTTRFPAWLAALGLTACSLEPNPTPFDPSEPGTDPNAEGTVGTDRTPGVDGLEGGSDAADGMDGQSAAPDVSSSSDALSPDVVTPGLSPPEELPALDGPPTLMTTLSGTPVVTPADWEASRVPELMTLLDHYVYGRAPALRGVTITGSTSVPILDGLGVLEERTLVIEGLDAHPLHLAIFRPAGEGPFPVWLALNACGNQTVLADTAVRLTTGWREPACVGATVDESRGTQAERFPVAQILAAGHALIALHQSDIAPDDPGAGLAGVRAAIDVGGPTETQWGVLKAWSWGLLHVAQAVPELESLDPTRVAAVGHSRRGKVVLLAAAMDRGADAPLITLAVAHQSGTAGARLSRSDDGGEPIEAITLAFPHWFGAYFPAFSKREDHLPLDQHFLLALVAPRPLLLSNGEDDDWAGPAGTLEAATLASPAWTLLGGDGLGAPQALDAPLAYHVRPGGHSLGPEDWAVFLDFAGRHVAP